MRELRSRAGALAGQAQGEAVQEQLRKLADDFRFSDPVSSEATFPLESELRACMDNLEHALTDGDMDGVAKLCPKAAALLAVCTMAAYRSRAQRSAGAAPRLTLYMQPGEEPLAAAGALVEALRLHETDTQQMNGAQTPEEAKHEE